MPAAGTYTFQFQIPVEITVKIGGTVVRSGSAPDRRRHGDRTGASSTRGAAETASQRAQALAGRPDVIRVRPGYRFKRGWITDERVVVVEVRKKLSPTELRATATPAIPGQFLGVGVDVRTAALPDQLEHLGIDLAALEAPPKPGGYQEPPNLSLDPVQERMQAIFHISPDSGFPEPARLPRARQAPADGDDVRVGGGAYQRRHRAGDCARRPEAEDGDAARGHARSRRRHADTSGRRQVRARVGLGWRRQAVPQRLPHQGRVARRRGILAVERQLEGLEPAQHRSGRRELHADRAAARSEPRLARHHRNDKLAKMFQKYIEFDFNEARARAGRRRARGAAAGVVRARGGVRRRTRAPPAIEYKDPLVVDEVLDVRPLLTPDKDARGHRMFLDTATKLVQRATRTIFLQNQSFNMLEENVDEFEQIFGALTRQTAGGPGRAHHLPRRARIQSGQRAQAAGTARTPEGLRLRHGHDPRPDALPHEGDHHRPEGRRQHDSGEVLFGSHNLTNAGALFNRDASLLVKDPEVTDYFAKAFLFDWEVLAKQEADELVGGVRVALAGRGDAARIPACVVERVPRRGLTRPQTITAVRSVLKTVRASTSA